MVCTPFKEIGQLVISFFAGLTRQMTKIRWRCFLKESHKDRFSQAAVGSYLVLVLGEDISKNQVREHGFPQEVFVSAFRLQGRNLLVAPGTQQFVVFAFHYGGASL